VAAGARFMSEPAGRPGEGLPAAGLPVGAAAPASAGGAARGPASELPRAGAGSRHCLVVLSGSTRTGERTALALVDHLAGLGVACTYMGRQERADLIAAAADEIQADAIELCLGRGGVTLLRNLLRELTNCGRREVSIVVHRVD
jgi:hypothetical protein